MITEYQDLDPDGSYYILRATIMHSRKFSEKCFGLFAHATTRQHLISSKHDKENMSINTFC